jgi:hypothetical protein
MGRELEKGRGRGRESEERMEGVEVQGEIGEKGGREVHASSFLTPFAAPAMDR